MAETRDGAAERAARLRRQIDEIVGAPRPPDRDGEAPTSSPRQDPSPRSPHERIQERMRELDGER